MDYITPKRIKILAIILCMILVISLVCCSGNQEEEVETPSEPTEIVTEGPTEEPTEAPTEAAPVIANMGTITAGELNIREEPGSKYDSVGTYHNGDRIEILETKNVDDTLWGRTNLGWVGMGYVRMDGTTLPENDAVTSDGKTTVLGYGVVDLGSLNVRLGPGTDYAKVRTVTSGTRYAYYQQEKDWVRIEDGWVSTEYFYLEGTIAEDAITGTITAEDLNVRTGPDTSFKSNGSYKQGEVVEIYAQVAAWGYTEKGWIFMTYVEPVEPTYTTGTGTVTSGLNIRSEPNADSESVGTYKEGDIVTIIEVQDNWGKTDKGWINLKYVSYG